MARLDTKQVAERLGVSYVVAAGLVKHLVATGQATLVEKRKSEKTEKNPAGLGKPTSIYEVADSVSLDLTSVPAVAVAAVEVADADTAEAA